MKPDFFDWHLTQRTPMILRRQQIIAHAYEFYDFHRSIHILFRQSGDLSMEIRKHRISMDTCGCLITAPWELHGEMNSLNGCRLLMTVIRPESIYDALLSKSGKLRSFLILESDIRHNLLRQCGLAPEIRNTTEALENSNILLEQWHAIVGFFIKIVTGIPDYMIPDRKESPDFILVPAFKLMYSSHQKKCSAEEAAQACDMGISRFRGLFRQTTGIPFAEYELRYRLKLAQEELEKNKLPLKEIAAEFGFHDSSHFSHTFKKYFGSTPKQYLTGNI